MALFGFGKKKDEEKNIPACACQSDCATFEATEEDANKVKIEDGNNERQSSWRGLRFLP